MNSIILGAIGPWQIVIIVLVIVLLFGSAKIPELMRNLGKGIGEIVAAFLKQHYSQSIHLPKEILLEKQPEEK